MSNSYFCSVYTGSGTTWPRRPFPANYFAGWDCARIQEATTAWNFFEQVEAADAATRVRLSGTSWKPPHATVFAEDPAIWFRIQSGGYWTQYRLGQSLHKQVCPNTNWRSQRSYGISSTPISNVYPGTS